MIEVVTATRLSGERFWVESATGLSLQRLAHDVRLRVRVALDNRMGLPIIYNTVIAGCGSSANSGASCADSDSALVFIHDDVWIDDIHFVDRILDGLARFDVIGVAGNLRCLPGQPAWAFADDRMQWDDHAFLSGAIAHGASACGPVSRFGPVPAPCELLDGVLLAARRGRLLEAGVRFDPQFDFHFYDMDFCRSARAAGLTLGTWPISLTHQSGGAFGSLAWRTKREEYIRKWGS